MKATIVNYGIGNVLSVQRAFEYVGAQVTFAEDPATISAAERLVVPGVGAFPKCMEAIDHRGMRGALIDFAMSGKPYLGICVGMQMLLDRSFEFGEHKGLGIIPGDVRKIDVPGECVPVIGWKQVIINKRPCYFYFVHSYQAVPKIRDTIFATYTLGDVEICAAVKKGTVLGLQFHPEKSAHDGLDLIEFFLNM